jgi:hypothetical protein
LSLATIHQLLTPNFLKSCNTPSIYLTMSRPSLLLPSGLDSIILRGISLLLIPWMCPAHLNLPLLIVPTISDDLYSWYNSWLYLSRHSPFSCIGPKIFLSIFLSVRRADHSSKGVLPCVLTRLGNLSMWGGQGPYKDCRATDDDDFPFRGVEVSYVWLC